MSHREDLRGSTGNAATQIGKKAHLHFLVPMSRGKQPPLPSGTQKIKLQRCPVGFRGKGKGHPPTGRGGPRGSE